MERTKIKNLARQIRGVSYKPEDLHDSLDDTAVILLRANNIDEGKINFDDVVYVDKSKVSNEQYLKVGDVLLCASSGSKQLVGKAASVDFDTPCTFGAFCKVVRPNNDVADYLGKYFQSGVYRRKISEVAIGANINNIRNEHIDSLDIPIYESDQVRGIVEKIGLLQSIIDNRKCELSKLDELIKARFVEMFGNLEDNVRLGDCCDVHARIGWQALTRDEHMKTGDYILVTGTDFKDGRVNYDTCVYVSKERYEMDPHIILKENDVLITKDGSIGKVAVVHDLPKPATLNGGVFVVRPDDRFNKEYISYVFRGPLFERFVNLSKTGATIKHLNQKHLVEFEIPLPSMEKQEEFAKFSKQVDKSKVVVQKALDETQILFDSLMQEYFG